MHFLFTKKGSPDVSVRIARNVDLTDSVSEFTVEGSTSPRQILGQRYAEATYLKYQSAYKHFGAIVSSLSDWAERRGVEEVQRRECMMLLEARIANDKRIAGALLLRSAWTNDVVVDFLVVNHLVMQEYKPAVRGAGVMLCYAAFSIGLVSEASLVIAETAQHSTEYWARFCPGGMRLIRTAKTQLAVRQAAHMLSKGGIMPHFHVNS
jgi:hypothetical protein